jgi:isobutyryl-CoA dehydrogenase
MRLARFSSPLLSKVAARSTIALRPLSASTNGGDFTDPSLGLSEDQLLYLRTAQSFAETELAPYAAQWDAEKIFPVDALRRAAALGFGGLYADPKFGGSGMTRHDGSLVVEALAAADTSTTAYLTIHNMVR